MANWVLFPLLLFYRLTRSLVSQIIIRIMSTLIPSVYKRVPLNNTNLGAGDTPLEDRLKAIYELARNPSFSLPEVVVWYYLIVYNSEILINCF